MCCLSWFQSEVWRGTAQKHPLPPDSQGAALQSHGPRNGLASPLPFPAFPCIPALGRQSGGRHTDVWVIAVCRGHTRSPAIFLGFEPRAWSPLGAGITLLWT